MRSYLKSIENKSSIYEEKNFDERLEVIDFIEFQFIDQIEGLIRKSARPDKLNLVKFRAEKLKSELEQMNTNMFQSLQEKIRSEKCSGKKFKDLVHEYVCFSVDESKLQGETGYDNLDILINGLSPFQTMPVQTKNLEPDMVYYQKTPARVIFELVEKAEITKEDIFIDLGSGLGQAVILVNLLTGIPSKGVEFESAFCEYANASAASLQLSNVSFVNTDAREADYSEGTVFFMFTPFKGEILQEVLEILKRESQRRKIKIITYGPCYTQVALQSWLNSASSEVHNMYKLGVFSSSPD